MSKYTVAAALLAGLSFGAHAAKPCEELKGEIAAKLDAKGVQNYTLTIVPTADVGDQKVVGGCNGGQNKITYVRGAAAAPAAAPAAEAAPKAAPAPTP
jgi:hypothetical protein